MLHRDLPPLTKRTKQEALHELARAGLSFGDCLEFFASHRTEEALYYVKHAQTHMASEGDVEVDDNALVSRPSAETCASGVYVMSWLWVPQQKQVGKQQ